MSLANGKESEFSVTAEIRYQQPMRRDTRWYTRGCAQRAYIASGLPNLTCFLRGNPSSEPVTMIGLGGTQVSTKHANSIVLLGTATATDIDDLIEEVQLVVQRQKNVELEREIRMIGEWN